MSTFPQQQAPPQEQQAEATIQSVTHDAQSGWYTITTDQGEFSTKFPEPAQEAHGYVGQRVTLVYQEPPPRQGRNGQWYQSRYLRRIIAAYGAPQQQPMHPSVQAFQPERPAQPQAPPQQDSRELRIMRQTAAKLAVQTIALVPSDERSFSNQVAVAEAWLRYFVNGPQVAGIAEPDAPADDIPW